MKPDIYWLKEIEPIRLAIMPKPRSGEWLADEIAGYSVDGVSVLVSLLESQEIYELGLGDEARLCQEHSIEFISYPIADRHVPLSVELTRELVADLIGKLHTGQGVAIHCRAGIGRSGIIAAWILIKLGFTVEHAFSMLSVARRTKVPDTAAQKDWVIKHA